MTLCSEQQHVICGRTGLHVQLEDAGLLDVMLAIFVVQRRDRCRLHLARNAGYSTAQSGEGAGAAETTTLKWEVT